MAVTKSIIKNSHLESVVKVQGTAAAAVIALATDLLATNQLVDGATQTVSIIGVVWTGAANGIVTITRGATTIMTLQANAAGMLDFSGQMMTPDNTAATTDITVTISGAQAECLLRLRKNGGYKSTIETEQFGAYDNPAVAGS